MSETEIKTVEVNYANGTMCLFKDWKCDVGSKVGYSKNFYQSEVDRMLHKGFTEKWKTAKMTFSEIMDSLKFMDHVSLLTGAAVEVSFLQSWSSLYGYMIKFSGVLMDHDKLRTLPGPLTITPTTVNGFPINEFAVGTEILALDGQEITVGEKLFRVEGENLIMVKEGNKYPRDCSFEYRFNNERVTYKDGYLTVGQHMVKLVFPNKPTV
jgi:hypothetical protein